MIKLSILNAAIAFVFLCTNHFVHAQYLINDLGVTQTIDFDGFQGDGFSTTPSATQLNSNEWEVLGMSDGDLNFGDEGVTGDFARGSSTGGVTTGGVYSFDVGTGNGSSLGVQPGGTDFTPGSFTLQIQNDTGDDINTLTVTYDVFVFNDQDRANSFNFEHGSDNVIFTQESSLDLVSPEAQDASPTWEVNNRSIVITGLTLNDGDTYFLRWTSDDVSGGGSRDEFALDNITILGAQSTTPLVTVTPSLLSGFVQTLGSPSAEQSFDVAGINLTDDILVEVSAGEYEIAENVGGPWSTSITLNEASGSVATTTLYARLNGSAVSNPENGTITISSLGANSEEIQLEGEIQAAPTPTITVSPSLLTGFTQTIGSPSPEQSFTVEGSDLTDDIILTVVAGDYEISTDASGPYSTSLTITESGGTVSSTSIFTRLNGAALATPANGQIELTSTNASNETVDLEGEIVPVPTSIIIDFEGSGETKTGYASAIVNLSGLDWDLDEVLIGTSGNDFLNGTRSARLRGRNDAHMTMQEDKANGLGELTFEYREFGTDANQQPWNVDYSTDQGATWTTIGTITATDVVQTFSETVNVTGDVRIRIIIASSPGTTGDRRMNIDDIELNNFTPDPEVSVTPSLLTGFLQTVGTPSASQTFEVAGNFLTDDVLVEVSAGEYEIADDAGGPWSTSITLSESNGAVAATTLFVRLNGASPSNPENGTVTISSPGASTEELALEGVIQAAGTPTINVSPSALSGFTQVLGSPSAEQTITVSGTDLNDAITLNLAGTDYEISTTSGSGFGASVTLAESNGEVAATTVYVRLNGTAVNANVTDVINLTSVGAQAQTVNLSGEIIETPTLSTSVAELTGFFQVIGTPSVSQSVDVSGINLLDDVTIAVTSGDYEIADDAAGPWGTSLNYTENNGELTATPVFVRLNGTTVQNPAEGELTVSSVNALDVIVTLTGEIQEPNDPLIVASPLNLTGFLQETGAPSAGQSFEVEGSDLNGAIELEATNDYEISTDASGPYSATLSLTQTGGTVAQTTIYVRLNGTTVTNPANGEVIISSTDAATVTVTLEGEIVQGCNLDVTVNQASNFELTAVQENVSYQWIDCDDNLAWIPGANQQSFLPTEDGSYAVILTQDATCIDTSDCIVIDAGLSTENHNFEAGVSLYPNPVNEELNIQSLNAIITSITIYTMDGKLIDRIVCNANDAFIHTGNWAKGAYQIVIQSENNRLVRKVVK